MLKNMKLGTKLIGGFMLIAIIVLVAAGTGYYGSKTINGSMTSMYANRLLPIAQLGNAKAAVLTLRGQVFKSLLIPEELAKGPELIATEVEAVNKNIKDYKATELLPEEIHHQLGHGVLGGSPQGHADRTTGRGRPEAGPRAEDAGDPRPGAWVQSAGHDHARR